MFWGTTSGLDAKADGYKLVFLSKIRLCCTGTALKSEDLLV